MQKILSKLRKLLSCRQITSHHRLMTAIVMGLGLFNLFFGEVVPAGGGFGWDGVIYADITRNLPSLVGNGELSSYYAKRILPSCAVRGILSAVGSSFDNINIVKGFRTYNLIILILATFIWKRIANGLSINLVGRWVGFGAIFMNFNCSKAMLYLSVSTDPTALVLGLLILMLYLEGRTSSLLVATIVGSFAWQIVSLCGAILLLFPRNVQAPNIGDSGKELYTATKAQLQQCLRIGWVVIVVASICGIVISLNLGLLLPLGRIVKASSTHGVDWVITRAGFWFAIILTGVPSILAAVTAIGMLMCSKSWLSKEFDRFWKSGLLSKVAAVVAIAAPAIVVHAISNPSIPNATGVGGILGVMFFPPIGKVLLPLVGLAAFWGPMVLVLATRWGAFCREAQALGLGFVAVIALNLPLGLATEPRYVTLAWPFVVLGGVMVLERCETSKGFCWAFGVLTVLYGQFWLKINLAPWVGGDYEGLQEFPKQVLFMHYGFWMSNWAYVGYLIAAVASLYWLNCTFGRHEYPSAQHLKG